MPQISRIAALTLLAAVFAGAPSLAQVVEIVGGVTPRGVFYTIAVPSPWNGELVIYNHGFSLTPAGPGPSLGPLAPLQLNEGYAVAASGYSQVGWAVFKTKEDLEELYETFVGGFGEPTRVYLFGVSLGGLVTAQAIEQADIGNVVGALSICGAMAGSRNWDGALDLRRLYDVICEDVPGAAIPGGAQGLPFGSTLTPVDVVMAANACFAHDAPPDARTPEQQARLDRFEALIQIPPEFFNTTLGFFATFAFADLSYDPEKLDGKPAIGNRQVDYGDAMINADIERGGARRAQRRKLANSYTPNGNVGDVKIVSIHTDKDGLVIVENESEYASKVPAENLTVAVVVEAVPSHCGFSAAETAAAWETLRGWTALPRPDPQPTARGLQAVCGAIEAALGGPCRFDPSFQIPDMDIRIRPRRPGNKVLAASASSSLAPAAPMEAAPSSPEEAAAPPVQIGPARSPRTGEIGDPTVEHRMRNLDRRQR